MRTEQWYRSPDGKVWTPYGRWRKGADKQLWIKPVGARLEVSGRRLDGDAPALKSFIGEAHPADYQPSWVIVPTEGCWEVVARVVDGAEDSVLRFVSYVRPSPPGPTGSCHSLAEVAWTSDAIIVGRVEQREAEPGGWSWQTVRVLEVLKNPYMRAFDEQILLLQQAQREPRLEPGHTYLLFVRDDPRQIVCPQRTLAEVVYDEEGTARVVRMPQTAHEEALWSGDTLQAVVAEVRAHAFRPTPTPARH
jgi:hypothetical protein